MYSTKKAYQRNLIGVASGSNNIELNMPAFKQLWNIHAPRRVSAIAWKILRQRIPTKDKLRRRGIQIKEEEAKCVMCDEQNEENISHLLFECKMTHAIWSNIHSWLRIAIRISCNTVICLGRRKERCLQYNLAMCCVVDLEGMK